MATVTADPSGTRLLEKVKSISTLGTLPEITAQIVKTVEDPGSTPAHLHKIIAHDPALVARILKVVNSAFFGLPGQIASVERGIVLLGVNAVKNIAVAAGLGQLFRGVKLCEGFSARDLWQHCIAVGVAARELARQLKLPLADEAFLAGLIHDLGILALLQLHPQGLRDACDRARDSDEPFCQIERQISQTDHQELGQALAEQWRFPRTCQLVAGAHHQPERLGENRVLASLVHAADTLCCQEGMGFYLTARGQDPLAGGLVAPELLERLRKQLPQLVAEGARVFG